MKQLYFLLILTLSFGVYSQTTGSVLTYNFDSATNAAGFVTAYDDAETSYTGTKVQAGYLGILGVPATNHPGAIKCPKDDGSSGLPKLPTTNASGATVAGSTAWYSARFPNTSTNNGRTPFPSLNVDVSGKVHYSIAFKGWQITNGSNNNFQFNLKNSENKMIACIKIEQDKSEGAFVDDKVRIVGTLWNNTGAGKQYSVGHFGVGSGTNTTTPVNVGITIDYVNDTWAFFTGTPGNIAGFTGGTYSGHTGTFGTTDGTLAISTAPPIPDFISFGFRRPAGGTNTTEGTVGTEDYIIIDQIKVHQGEYVNTLSTEDLAMEDSFAIYPNPADNFVVLQNAKVGEKLDLFDVVGKKVRSFNVESESQKLDISDLKTGVYFARSNQLEAIKIIKR